jgi:hypothetical protein
VIMLLRQSWVTSYVPRVSLTCREDSPSGNGTQSTGSSKIRSCSKVFSAKLQINESVSLCHGGVPDQMDHCFPHQANGIDQASFGASMIRIRVNTTYRNASRPGLLVTCCRSPISPRESEGITAAALRAERRRLLRSSASGGFSPCSRTPRSICQ